VKVFVSVTLFSKEELGGFEIFLVPSVLGGNAYSAVLLGWYAFPRRSMGTSDINDLCFYKIPFSKGGG
jgi:hypothetical protein